MSGWLWGIGSAFVAALTICPGWAGPRPLTRAEMESVRGGHGPTCTECTSDLYVLHECKHSTPTDSCLTSECIEFQIVEDTCFLRESGICLADIIDYALAAVKYVRRDTNCTTSNSGPLQLALTHIYGSECLAKNWYTRCQKTGGPCNGTLLGSSNLYFGISCY